MHHILVVDDDPDIHALIKRFFLRRNFRLITANSGQTGIAMALDGNPDLILLDLQLPDFDGFAYIEALRKYPLAENLPIVMITSSKEIANVKKAKEIGIYDFIIKPFKSQTLYDKSVLAIQNTRAKILAADVQREKNLSICQGDSLTEIRFDCAGINTKLREELKEITQDSFVQKTKDKPLILDIRNLKELGTRDVDFIRGLLGKFKDHRLLFLVGRHYGHLAHVIPIRRNFHIFIMEKDLQKFRQSLNNKKT